MADKILKDRESNVLDDMIGGTVEFLSDTAVQLVEAVLWAVNRILFVFIKLIKLIIGSFKLIMKHIPRVVTPVMPEKSKSGLNQTLKTMKNLLTKSVIDNIFPLTKINGVS